MLYLAKCFVASCLYYISPTTKKYEKWFFDLLSKNSMFIKLSQWYFSRHEKKVGCEFDVFENVLEHNFDHTMNVLNDENLHNILLDSCKPIASGSIGQVYKGYYQKKKVAVKVRHPGVLDHFWFFKIVFKIIKKLNLLKLVDGISFLQQFRSQTDFRNEANNLKLFSESFKTSDIVIIPDVLYASEKLLVTTFHDGKSIEELETESEQFRAGIILICFCKQSLCKNGMIHADLHKGNYKFSNDYKLILYDFGVIAKMEEGQKHIIIDLVDYFQKGDYLSLYKLILSHGLVENATEEERKYILDHESTKEINKCHSLNEILTVTNSILKFHSKSMLNVYVTFILGISLIENTLISLGLIDTEEEEYLNDRAPFKIRKAQYHNRLVQQLAFCKQHNEFPELQDVNTRRLKENKTKTLFEKTSTAEFSLHEYYSKRT